MLKLFDFRCPKCSYEEERLIESSEVVKCLVCGAHMKKKIGAPPFHLKGKGWAKDNYGLKKESKNDKTSTQ